MDAKIAVLFPGIGYNTDKPLLYHSAKIAADHDYKIKRLEFSGFPRNVSNDRAALLKAYAIAGAQSREQLKFINFSDYDDIVFISKSIGTVGAAVVARQDMVPARHILFTPLDQLFSIIDPGDNLVFSGTNDRFVKPDFIRAECEKKGFTLRSIDGGKHSLETGEAMKDLENLVSIMKDVDDFLRAES